MWESNATQSDKSVNSDVIKSYVMHRKAMSPNLEQATIG